jgi:hypothetical protein
LKCFTNTIKLNRSSEQQKRKSPKAPERDIRFVGKRISIFPKNRKWIYMTNTAGAHHWTIAVILETEKIMQPATHAGNQP